MEYTALPLFPPPPLLAPAVTESPFERLVGQGSLALFEWLNVNDAMKLRQCSKLLREDVKEYPWGWNVKDKFDNNLKTVNLRKWRACFPNAKSAVLSRRAVFSVDDFVHLRGLRKFKLNSNRSITDAAFVHLRGINTLDMYGCTQITDQAFEYLRGINTLYMGGCRASSIATAKRVLGDILCFDADDDDFDDDFDDEGDDDDEDDDEGDDDDDDA